MRERIVGLTLLAAVVAITLFGLPLAVGAARYYAVEERTDLSDDAEALVGSVEAGLVPGAPLPAVADVRPGDAAALYDIAGRRLSGTGPDRLEASLDRARTGHRARATDADDYLVAVPVRQDDRQVAVLREARSDDDVRARIGWTWAGMVALAVAAVAGSRWVAGRLAKRMAGPLEDLAADAARIGDGDFRVHGHACGVVEIDGARRALQDTAARLADLLARERAFSTEASHQLRTPVMRLRLRLEEAAGAGHADAVAGAIAVTDDLARTVEELLRLARDPSGSQVPVDVGPLVEQTVTRYAGPPGRGPSVAVRDEGLRVAASAAAVRQILGVLIDNAVVHGEGAVTVEVRRSGTAVAVDVADEGALGEGSDPFRRRSAAETRAGHGIGLVLARRLAEAEGGRLRLRSTSPTVFSLLLRTAAEDRGEERGGS